MTRSQSRSPFLHMLTCMVILWCACLPARAQIKGGGGVRIMQVVDVAGHPLTLSPVGVEASLYLLDSASGRALQALELAPQPEDKRLPRIPAQLYLAPYPNDGGVRVTTSHLRLVLVYKADTMVLDLIDVMGNNGSGTCDEIQKLEFRPGHMVSYRDPARAIPDYWQHRDNSNRSAIWQLLKSGLHRASFPQLMEYGLLRFTPATSRQSYPPIFPRDSSARVQLVISNGDVMILRLNGNLKTTGACKPTVLIGLQRLDTTWKFILDPRDVTQMDCGIAHTRCDRQVTSLRISSFGQDMMGKWIVAPPGQYRAVVMDAAQQLHYSEAVTFHGKPAGLPSAAQPYRQFCHPQQSEQGSTVMLTLSWAPARAGSIDTYHLLACDRPNGQQPGAGNAQFNLLQSTLTTHDLHVNGKPFNGCIKIAAQAFNPLNEMGSNGFMIMARYYYAGKIVRIDNYAVDDLNDEHLNPH